MTRYELSTLTPEAGVDRQFFDGRFVPKVVAPASEKRSRSKERGHWSAAGEYDGRLSGLSEATSSINKG